jgi:hypothetical protein
MNPHLSIKIYLIITLLIIGFNQVNCQDWARGDVKNFQLKNWDINLNAGLTTLYGDLSIYDDNIFQKYKNEGGFGCGLVVTKMFNPAIGLSGQLLYGNLMGRKEQISMTSSFFEYNMHLRINLIELFNGMHQSRISLVGFAGIGNFIFNTTLTEYYEGVEEVRETRTRVPEFIYFLGGGIGYSLNDNIALSLEMSLRKCENDKIDGVSAGTGFDYYTYLSTGITYKINNNFRMRNYNRTKVVQNNPKRKPRYRQFVSYP